LEPPTHSFSPSVDALSSPTAVRNVNPQVWVALGSTSLIGLCAYPVFRTDVRPGHDLFSSEKPEVIREAQESKRKEYRRLIKEQRKEIEADKEILRQKQIQQQQKQQ
jgi:hypothetical protein